VENPSWGWGLSLIAVTIAIHATAVVMMAFAAVRIRARLETCRHDLWKLIAVLICMIVAIGLLLAVVHALLYSVDSMSTRGATRLVLQRHWQMMGALEAVDGMLLFGVSAAYIFAVMQTFWSMLSVHTTPKRS
jgi:hypothetical protein